jgi:acetolactate synthase-1/3 small subunit
MQATFVVHMEDRPGVLNRVASLIRRRGFNIESVTVGRTETPGLSRMTLVVDTDEAAVARLRSNLDKLVNVRRVQDVTLAAAVVRDLAMIKVSATAQTRSQIMQLADVFRARVVDVAPDSLVIEITGTEDKVDGLLEMLRPYGVLEMARTGRVAMVRGAASRMVGENGRIEGRGTKSLTRFRFEQVRIGSNRFE